MAVDPPRTTALRRQQMMSSLFLLVTFSLHGTISYVDLSRQNSVIGDDNNTGKAVQSTGNMGAVQLLSD